jgi:hypothetical protein
MMVARWFSDDFSSLSEYLRPGTPHHQVVIIVPKPPTIFYYITNHGQFIAHGICRLSKVELALEVPPQRTSDIQLHRLCGRGNIVFIPSFSSQPYSKLGEVHPRSVKLNI